MEKQFSVTINENDYNEAMDILEDVGLDLVSFTKMAIKKLLKEEGIDFLVKKDIPGRHHEKDKTYKWNINLGDSLKKGADVIGDVNDIISNVFDVMKMTKTKALHLFKVDDTDILFSKNVTFASKNQAADHYWANPNIDVLEEDWYLILNDQINRHLFLFVIAEDSLTESDFVKRADNENLIDLQIAYDDPTFTDKRSHVSFAKFLAKTTKY